MNDAQATILTSPLASAIDPDILLAIAGLGDVDVLARFPASSVATDSGWVGDELQGAGRQWDRQGNPVEDAARFRFDVQAPTGRDLIGGVLEQLTELGFGGVDLGTVDGQPAYDPPTASDREHVPHAGPFRTSGLRALYRAFTSALVTDFHEEHLAGDVDLAADADDHTPGHLAMAEETLLALGTTDVDPQSRDMSTPIRSIVHGARAAFGRVIAPLVTSPRAGGLFLPQGGFAGLSQDQHTEILAFQIASLVIQGIKPTLQTLADHFPFRIRPDSDEPIVAFLASAFQALRDTDWIADFLAYGKHELPLVIDAWSEFSAEFGPEFGPGPRLVNNPLAVVSTLVPPALLATVIPPGTAWEHAHATEDFRLPAVLHTVRKHVSTSDRLFAVINWTVQDAFFGGRFCPWMYWATGAFNQEFSAEFATTAPYRIDRLNSDGTETAIATGIYTHSNLLCSGTSGTVSDQDVSLGLVPALSIQAYRLRQE